MGELQGEWHHAASGVVERSGRWFQKFFAGRWSPGVHGPIVANNGCNTEVLQVALCTSMHSVQEVCKADLHLWNADHQWLCSFGCQNPQHWGAVLESRLRSTCSNICCTHISSCYSPAVKRLLVYFYSTASRMKIKLDEWAGWAGGWTASRYHVDV